MYSTPMEALLFIFMPNFLFILDRDGIVSVSLGTNIHIGDIITQFSDNSSAILLYLNNSVDENNTKICAFKVLIYLGGNLGFFCDFLEKTDIKIEVICQQGNSSVNIQYFLK
jgi:hypothetical protein